jgi:prepilin-type processing-associated H-X9-DG protein
MTTIFAAKEMAQGRSCSTNMRQIYVALQLYANNVYGKLPPCFEINTGGAAETPTSVFGVKENSWWYRKVSSLLYPRRDPLSDPTSPLTPEHWVFRCPASMDMHNDGRAPLTYPKVSTGPNSDKDRAFDDNYGYNNFGFKYAAPNGDRSAIPDPNYVRWGAVPVSAYYHTVNWCPTHGVVVSNANGVCPVCRGGLTTGGMTFGAITGRHKHILNNTTGTAKCDCGKAWPCVYAYLGELSEVREAPRTMLLVEYMKADVAPEFTNDFLRGYRFRHGGRGNVLFVDGHIVLYDGRSLVQDLVNDPATQRPRIHWDVFRP